MPALCGDKNGNEPQLDLLSFEIGGGALPKEAFKEAVLRPGERVAVWDYENGDGRDSQKIAAQVEDEERYAAAETRDEGTVFHAGEEDLQAFWNLQREAPDLQQIATKAQQHTMKPNQEREIGNERHY